LGASKQSGLPPEATQDLVNVWAYCLAIGHEFTVRQARWVCYLRFTSTVQENVAHSIPGSLFVAATVYATRERICEAMSKDMDTFDLDAEWVLPDSRVAGRTGALNRRPLDAFPVDLPKAGIKLPNVLSSSAGEMVLFDLGFTDEEIEGEIKFRNYAFDVKKPKETLEAALSAENAYAYWLRYLANGPKWTKLPHKAQKDIVITFTKDINTKLKNNSEEFLESDWEPTEVLRAVGYD